MSTSLLYFKRKNNACYTLNIKPVPPFNNIVNILAKKESILANNLLLIHRGKQVQNIEGLMKLGSKSIVHLVDLQQVKNERICINLRDIHNNQSTRIIDSSTKIGNFVRQHLSKIDQTPSFHIGLFYLGKVLNSQKTFAQQLVEQNSQLFVINLKDYSKGAKPVTQPQKVIVADQNQSLDIQPIIKINHRIQTKQPQDSLELKSAPIRTSDIKSQQIKDEQKVKQEQQIQQDYKIKQEQKQKQLNNIHLQDFKQTQSVELKEHELKNNQGDNLQNLNAEVQNEVRNQQIPVLQTEHKQVKLEQQKPKQKNMKQQKYIRTQSLQSKQNDNILHEIMDVSQLPEITYYNFKIKISQVESHKSESEPHNNVEFDQEDSHSIQSLECCKQLEKDQANQQKKKQIKQEIKFSQFLQPLEILGQRDILPGDLIFTGADYHNQTVSFIDNLLNQYKGMFE